MLKKTLILVVLTLMVISIFLLVGCGSSNDTKTEKASKLILATTTSTQDSGLLDELIPAFEKKYNVKVKTVAVGSGEALKMGEEGDADVLLVHAKDSEEELIKNGFGIERVEVMYNDFIVVGPEADPAAIKGSATAAEAFQKIAASGGNGTATFITRGDDSGTHKKELKIWAEAGIDPKGQAWYVQAGPSMGQALNVSNEKQAYTLADRGTYVSMQDKLPGTAILLEGDKSLKNQYAVIVVNPDKHPNVKLNVEGAGDFVEFLTSKEGQKEIEAYKVNNTVLFHANAQGETRGMGDEKE